jgi:hypothetical protein
MVLAEPLLRITEAGATEQVIPEAVQVRLTVPEKPLTDAI